MRCVKHEEIKDIKKEALKQAKRICKGKPDYVRHQTFIQLWESGLNECVSATLNQQ